MINNILKQIQIQKDIGPGVIDCGFIFENGETNADIIIDDKDNKNLKVPDKIAYFVTLDKVL